MYIGAYPPLFIHKKHCRIGPGLGGTSENPVKLDFSDLGAKGVGYALVTSLRQRGGDRSAYPICHDDMAFGPLRATFLQARLAKCSSPPDGRDPHTGPANGQRCPARDGLGPTQTLPSLPPAAKSRSLVAQDDRQLVQERGAQGGDRFPDGRVVLHGPVRRARALGSDP
jgi:hypothetical protein